MALSDKQIRNAKPEDKKYKLSDGDNLYLQILPSGGKSWLYRYRINGKSKETTFGQYPLVSLKEARIKRDELKRKVFDGSDVAAERRLEKIAKQHSDERTFKAVGREWYQKHSTDWSESQQSRTHNRLEKDVYPFIGTKDIKDVTAPELLAVLRMVEGRGAIETTHRIRRLCGQIFRYGIATGRCERDPSADLVGAIPPAKKSHYATITDPKQIGQLMRDIDNYWGNFVVKCALKFSPLVFQRPGEIRKAEWSEIDIDNAEWRIPDRRMKQKGRNAHIVPLSRQALEILNEVRKMTGDGKYVFPATHTTSRPMSENTINQALRRLGYGKDEMTAHGFRAMASTTLNEQGWNTDAIERQLAHVEQNEVKRAYNHAEHLPERRRMMQAWADYLDGIASGAEVVPIRKVEGQK